MNEPSDQGATPQTIEEELGGLLCKARESVRSCREDYERRIRKSPSKAMLAAVAAGYLLHRVPVRAILVTQVRVLSALAPPALVFFGAAKFYDLLQKQDFAKGNSAE